MRMERRDSGLTRAAHPDGELNTVISIPHVLQFDSNCNLSHDMYDLAETVMFNTHSLQLAVSVAALLALSRVIEPVYGSHEYLKFLAIVDTAAVRLIGQLCMCTRRYAHVHVLLVSPCSVPSSRGLAHSSRST